MARETGIVKLEYILARLRAGDSIKRICRETGAHRSVVRRVARVTSANGWQLPEAPPPTVSQLKAACFGASSSRQPHQLDVFRSDFERWVQDGLTYDAMWRRVNANCRCSESQLRRYVQRTIPHAVNVVVRRETPLGVMEVDFAYLGLTLHPQSGITSKTWVFTGRLRYSRRSYRELVYRQDQDTFFDCHVRAFRVFGGVPEMTVPDNLRAAVVKASFVDPLLNRSYLELAQHYGFRISPCNPYSPQHKGGVESDARYIQSSFWRPFVSDQRALGHAVPRRDEAEAALRQWERDVADVRLVAGVGRSPNVLFAEELPSLRPLPLTDWEPVRWQKGLVGRTQMVCVDRARYSVPERFLGREVLVRLTTRQVVIFHENEQIAAHVRAKYARQDVWDETHRGAAHRRYLSWNRANVEQQAAVIAPSVAAVVRALLDRPGADGLRPAYGVIRLAAKYTVPRLAAACRRAQFYEQVGYGYIKSILEHDQDKLEIDDATDVQGQPRFAFARPSTFFDTSSPKEASHE